MLLGKKESCQDTVYVYNQIPCHQAWTRPMGSWRMVTDGRYAFTKTQENIPYAFYDHQEDPLELHDLKDDAQSAMERDQIGRASCRERV